MTLLITEILKDYGGACLAIGKYLSIKDCSTLREIRNSTKVEESYIYYGLAILIQRRIVYTVTYDKTTFYKFDRKMAMRRLFFNAYARYVCDRFESHKAFVKILVSGTSRIANYKENMGSLIQTGIIKEISMKDIKYSNEKDEDNKRRDLKTMFIVDFEVLDRLLMDIYTLHLISKRYSLAMSEVFKAIFKCTIVDRQNILNNLESTKLLIRDGITYVNDIANIDEYIKYLASIGLIKKDFDGDNCYKHNRTKCYDLLKIREMNKIFQDKATKRLLNLFYSLTSLEDSEVTKKSLLPLSKVKNSIFVLHKYGCINLEYPSIGSEGSKHPTIWRFNLEEFTGVIIKRIEKELEATLNSINHAWDIGNFTDSESFLLDIAKLICLSEKYFILMKKL